MKTNIFMRLKENRFLTQILFKNKLQMQFNMY